MDLIATKKLTNRGSNSKLAFTTSGGGSWPVWDRFISIDSDPVFHIGNICGTCEFFFRRVSASDVDSFEIEEIRSILESGLSRIDKNVLKLKQVIPNGKYTVALFTALPRQIDATHTPDYFAHEQRLAWGPADDESVPGTQYYRGDSRPIGKDKMLFEFFVPFTNPNSTDPDRVNHYKELLASGSRPTAISLAVLDVKSSATRYSQYPEHWCFANYLIDGHHKVLASDQSNLPITMLSFISLDQSWKLVGKMLSAYEKFG